MATVLLVMLVGALLLVIGPSLVSRYSGSTLVAAAVRGLGAVAILYGFASTSFVVVPDGHLGQLFRVYGGGPLTEGRILAVHGENGPQARILTPGFHFWPFVNVIYDVDTGKTEVSIPKGRVGLLTAKDGAPLRAGQAFADPFPADLGSEMLDAESFLTKGGQRGPQLTVLTPGKYRLNRYLWDIAEVDAKEVRTGFVGVVKSNVYADIDFGTLRADKPAKCDLVTVSRPDEKDKVEVPIVPVGCIGVWDKSLQPGLYYINPDAFALSELDTREQVWTYSGGYRRAKISLTVDHKGDLVQNRTEEEVPVPKENADRAVFVKMEGWDVPLELRVQAQVTPADASCVVAGVGSLQQVEERVLTPAIRAITRDVAGGSYEVTEAKLDDGSKPVLDKDGKPIFITVNRPSKVLDLINQRPLIEGEIVRRVRTEARKSCVTILGIRLGEPALPPELLVAVQREQLATQLARTYVLERAANEKRVDSEKARATADQQSKLVEAEINVQRSLQNAQAARNEGMGERDKLSLISEGQQKQVGVLGPEATVKLRQFELTLETFAKFANAHPEVLSAALANAQKFVPNVQVGSNGSSDGIAGMLMAILGQSLTGGQGLPGAGPATVAKMPAQR